MARKYQQIQRVEKGDYTEVGEYDTPRTPMTPLHNPAKRSRSAYSSIDSVFHFIKEAIDNAELNKPTTMKDKLATLTVPPGCGKAASTDVLGYWRDQKNLDGELAKVIALGLTATASQVTKERVHSILPLLLTDRNYDNKDNYVEQFAIVKLNMKWMAEEKIRLNKNKK